MTRGSRNGRSVNAPFSDRLIEVIRRDANPCCVGLDPRLDWLPAEYHSRLSTRPTRESVSRVLIDFHRRIIRTIAGLIPIVKPQLAFFEQLGAPGIVAFEDLVQYSHEHGILVIADAKRGDIGTTAEAYANTFFGGLSLLGNTLKTCVSDALTINPFFGTDGVAPFLDACDKQNTGIFVLLRTSNPSSSELQSLEFNGASLSHHIGNLVKNWSGVRINKNSYSSVGVVIGATQRTLLKNLRDLVPNSFVLLPGYGAQGGRAEDVIDAFDSKGLGGIVVAARSVNFAYRSSGVRETSNWESKIELAAQTMVNDVRNTLLQAGKWPTL